MSATAHAAPKSPIATGAATVTMRTIAPVIVVAAAPSAIVTTTATSILPVGAGTAEQTTDFSALLPRGNDEATAWVASSYLLQSAVQGLL